MRAPADPSPNARAGTGWAGASAAFAGFAGFLAFAFALLPALAGTHFLAFRDALQNYWPMKAAAWRGAAGPFATWNPDGFGGSSALADIVLQPFYLPELLFRVLRVPSPVGIAWALLLHAALAGAGMFALARRLVAPPAAALASSTLLVSGFWFANQSNFQFACAAAWVPAVLWAADRFARRPERREAALLALVVPQPLLAGDPQIFLLLAAALAVLLALRGGPDRLLRRGPVLLLCAAGALALLLVAPQLVASVRALPLLARGELTPALRETWSFHPGRVGELWVPRLFGPLLDPGFWGQATVSPPWKRNFIHSNYLGALWPPLVLAALVRRDTRRAAGWCLAAMFACGLAALGSHTPFYGFLTRVVPGWSLFRYPERLLLLPTVAGALLAGLGVRALWELPRARRVALIAGGMVLGLATLAASAAAAGAPLDQPDVRAALLRSALQLTAVGAVALGIAGSRLAPGPAALALVALTALDLTAANAELLGPLPRAPFEAPSRACLALREAAGTGGAGDPTLFRVFVDQVELQQNRGAVPDAVRASLPPWGISRWLEFQWGKRNTLSLCGLRSAVTLTSLEPLAETRVWRAAGTQRTLRALSTRFVVASASGLHARSPGARVVEREPDGAFAVVELTGWLPRLFRPARVVQMEPEAFLAALPKDAQLLTPAVAALASDLGPHAPAPRAEEANFRDSGDRIEFDVEQDGPGDWVLTAALDEDWRATLDGAPAAITPANLMHRAIWVPAGRHHVELRHLPRLLWVLFALSGLATVVLLATALPSTTPPC